MPVFLSHPRLVSSAVPPEPSFSALYRLSSLSRRMRTSGDRIERRAACIMERASNDSAGKIADTRDGHDLQLDYLPLHLSGHV